MTNRASSGIRPRSAPVVQIPLIAAALAFLAVFVGASIGSAATTGVAETRVRASQFVAQDIARPPEDIRAGKRLGNDVAEPEIVVATGVAAKTRPAESPHYSVAYETRLDSSAYPGRSDKFHFAAENRNLDEALQADPGFAASMDGLFPGITNFVRPGPRGAYPRRSPAELGLTWHHQTSPGVMQLIPTAHHMAPGPVQASLHPGGLGGMALWGGGR